MSMLPVGTILVINGTIQETEVRIVAKTIIYTLHGLLSLHFSDNALTQEVLYSKIDRVTEYRLRGEEHT